MAERSSARGGTQRRERGQPYRRRAGDQEYIRAVLLARLAMLDHGDVDQRPFAGAVAGALQLPGVLATDAGREAERVLEDVRRIGLDNLYDLAAERDRWLDELRSGPDGLPRVGDLYEQAAYDVWTRRLQDRGHSADELALFSEMWRRVGRRGGGIAALILFALMVDFVSQHEAQHADGPSRLASFLYGYGSIEGRSVDMAHLSYFLSRDLVAGRWEGVLAAALYDWDRTVMAAEAHIEATALAFHLDRTLRSTRYPADLTHALLDYHLARRAERPAFKDRAVGRLVYGDDPSKGPHGPVYRWGDRQYRRLPEVARMPVVEEYCVGFIQALDRLPIEALLLCPGRAIAYARAAGKNAANRRLPRMKEVDLFDEGVAREVDKTQYARWQADEMSAPPAPTTPSLDAIESIRTVVPHIDLYMRSLGGTVTKKELAAAEGISRPTLDARLRVARAAIDAFEAGATPQLGKLSRGIQFLRAALADGPKAKREIVRLANAEGIATRTVERAAREAGVRGTGARSCRIWAIPEA